MSMRLSPDEQNTLYGPMQLWYSFECTQKMPQYDITFVKQAINYFVNSFMMSNLLMLNTLNLIVITPFCLRSDVKKTYIHYVHLTALLTLGLLAHTAMPLIGSKSIDKLCMQINLLNRRMNRHWASINSISVGDFQNAPESLQAIWVKQWEITTDVKESINTSNDLQKSCAEIVGAQDEKCIVFTDKEKQSFLNKDFSSINFSSHITQNDKIVQPLKERLVNLITEVPFYMVISVARVVLGIYCKVVLEKLCGIEDFPLSTPVRWALMNLAGHLIAPISGETSKLMLKKGEVIDEACVYSRNANVVFGDELKVSAYKKAPQFLQDAWKKRLSIGPYFSTYLHERCNESLTIDEAYEASARALNAQ
ncbi:MAG: hypothetical protein P0S94_03055 [Simkaniaceae bacterium]|nr:hypothetical protein [Simkaniaceae bacterium]